MLTIGKKFQPRVKEDVNYRSCAQPAYSSHRVKTWNIFSQELPLCLVKVDQNGIILEPVAIFRSESFSITRVIG